MGVGLRFMDNARGVSLMDHLVSRSSVNCVAIGCLHDTDAMIVNSADAPTAR